MERGMKRLALVTLCAVTIGVTARAQNNWAHVGQDQGHTKYSTLDQINTSNVAKLQRVWTFNTGDKSGFFESTPLVIDGVMYLSAQNGVFALDPVTGTQQWKFEANGTTRRGVSYWPGDATSVPRIVVSSGTKLLALDPRTGRLVPEFGQGGFVEMGAQMETPPTIYKDLLL